MLDLAAAFAEDCAAGSVAANAPPSGAALMMGEVILHYHVAFYLPRDGEKMVVAEALDFPGAVSQGFDLADARVMIADLVELVPFVGPGFQPAAGF